MPRAAILYHSNTGNTRLACGYIANRVPQVDFDLFDMRDLSDLDIDQYEIIGFATYSDFQGPSGYFLQALEKISPRKDMAAFVFCTYAAVPGKTLKSMKEAVEKRGFNVIAGWALRMPENYPPLRKKGIKGDDNPKDKDLENFQDFIRRLGDMIITYHLKGEVESRPIKVGFFNSFFRGKDRKKAKKDMGRIVLDRNSCTKCGTCSTVCPHDAVSMNGFPTFDEGRCWGCYSCYNHCPVDAISTDKVESGYAYRGPSEDLKKRMSL